MASSVLLEKVVPALGAIISTLMYAAPIKAVLKAVSVKNLGVSRAVTWGLRASAQSCPNVQFQITPSRCILGTCRT